jgi:ribosomal-protein-alanine N-acetyltransferase
MAKMTISAMTENDIETVFAMEQASFLNPWSKSAFLNELSHTYSYNFVLKHKNSIENLQVVAYLCLRIIFDEIHILKIAVKKEKRRKGIAANFLTHCLELVSMHQNMTAVLEVRQSNKAGIGLYKKTGFHIIRQRPNYYSDTGENAILMGKTFKGGV